MRGSRSVAARRGSRTGQVSGRIDRRRFLRAIRRTVDDGALGTGVIEEHRPRRFDPDPVWRMLSTWVLLLAAGPGNSFIAGCM